MPPPNAQAPSHKGAKGLGEAYETLGALLLLLLSPPLVTRLPRSRVFSQTEIGRQFGLTQRKVSRIIAAAVKSLKDKLSQRW